MRQRLLICAKEYSGTHRGEDAIRVFAEFLEVSEGALKKWIYGSRTPTLQQILRIKKLTKGRMDIHHWSH